MFRNPVAVHRGQALEVLPSLVAHTPFVLVTSAGWRRRGWIDGLTQALGQPLLVIDQISENPSLQDLTPLEPLLQEHRAASGVVVALGGGSVMDAAKAIAAALSPGLVFSDIESAARAGEPLLPGSVPWPIYCVPTTAGTGSEVTSTATLWDKQTGEKFSLADERLYPRAAILDPFLLMTAPADLVLSTGLDALSHAMESMWSKKHNPVSDACAIGAIERVRHFLPAAISGDAVARGEMQTASLLAGLAISATRTALAHSISYPLTGRYGLRHGLACSFTLPSVAAFVLETAPDRARLIAGAFGAAPHDFPVALRQWMEALGVFDRVRRVIDPVSVAEIGDSLLSKGRADNSLRPATSADAQRVLRESLGDGPNRVAPPSPAPGRVIWVTGLSGAGKSTLGRVVARRLRSAGRHVILLDGDEMRQVFRSVTGHSESNRRELASTYSRLCQMLAAQGSDVVCCTMALFHECQRWNRENIPGYFEVFLKVDPAVVMARDPKGLYAKASRGEIRNMPGFDLPYEAPLRPDLVIDRNREDGDVELAADQLLADLSAARHSG